MLSRLFQRPQHTSHVPQHIYGRVVAQARHPVFYAQWNVPDTPIGRFELLSLHMFLLSQRLAQEEGETAKALSQEIFDAFIADLDRALRQLGIGDTSVPKRKKRMIATFYTQVEELAPLVEAGDRSALAASPLIAGLGGVENATAADKLARYVVAVRDALAGQTLDGIIDDAPGFPAPDEVQ